MCADFMHLSPGRSWGDPRVCWWVSCYYREVPEAIHFIKKELFGDHSFGGSSLGSAGPVGLTSGECGEVRA